MSDVMTTPAQRFQILSVKRKLWILLDPSFMMHAFSPAIPALSFAALTLITIPAQYVRTLVSPYGRIVERCGVAIFNVF
jgi:hypothetical protein